MKCCAPSVHANQCTTRKRTRCTCAVLTLHHALLLLQGRPRCLPERDAVVRVIRPLLSALGYLHEQGIIHR